VHQPNMPVKNARYEDGHFSFCKQACAIAIARLADGQTAANGSGHIYRELGLLGNSLSGG